MYELRPYQQEAIDDVSGEMMFGSSSVMLEAPTGCGKSLIMADFARMYADQGVMILVNITALIDQISEHLTEQGVEHSILKAGMEEKFNPNCKVQLVMSQTFYARMEKIDFGSPFAYYVQDEAHKEYATDRTKAVLARVKPDYKMLLSATPYDQDGFAFSGSSTINTISVKELEGQGFLSKVKYFVPKWAEKIDYSKIKKSGNDFSASELNDIIGQDAHLELALESMNQMNAKEKKTIVFCSNIEQCDKMTALLNEDGYEAFSYHSESDSKLSSRAMSSFKCNEPYIDLLDDENGLFGDSPDSKEVKCLVSVSKLSIGFDVKDIELGVQLRPTKVRSLYIQQVGRLTRVAPGKEFAEYLDLAQTVSMHGFHDEPYLAPTRTMDREADRKAKEGASNALEKLELTIEDEINEVTRKKYELKLEEIHRKEIEIQYQLEHGEPTLQDLAFLFKTTDDIEVMIACGAKLWTAKYGQPISKAGRPYNFDPNWLSELVVPVLSEAKYAHKHHQWFKAYRTRMTNLIKKDGSNFNAIRFFIDFLVKNEDEQMEQNFTMNQGEQIFIEDDEVPF